MDIVTINGKECSTLVSLAEEAVARGEADTHKPNDIVIGDFFDLRQEHSIEPYKKIGDCNYYLIPDLERVRQLYLAKLKSRAKKKDNPD